MFKSKIELNKSKFSSDSDIQSEIEIISDKQLSFQSENN